jgi:hypothetical protein
MSKDRTLLKHSITDVVAVAVHFMVAFELHF